MLECFTFVPEMQFGSNCYVLKSDGEYCIIDPSVSYETIKETLGDIKNCVKYIILTHCHFDHILELGDWLDETHLHPSMSENAAKNIRDSKVNCYRLFFRIEKAYLGECNILSEGDSLPLGNRTLRVIETPGHTNGSICVITDDFIFAGDTLFSGGSYGRYDLPSGNRAELSASINRILGYDDKTILSGHGEKTTVQTARKYRYL